MVEVDLVGEINTRAELSGAINVSSGGHSRCIEDIYLRNDKKLIFVFKDNSTIEVDLSSLGGAVGPVEELTTEQIQALNSMEALIDENGELIITYDENILDFDLSIQNDELIVENNMEQINFAIVDKELEVMY